MNSKGFSLIEILIVIIIFGVMAGLAVMGMNQSKNYAVVTTRDQMIEVLRGARAEAISRNALVGLEIVNASTGDVAVRVYTGSPGSYTVGSTLRSLRLNNTSVAFSWDITNTSNISAGTKGVVFNKWGTLDNATGTPVQVTLQNGPLIGLIKVERSTGYIY